MNGEHSNTPAPLSTDERSSSDAGCCAHLRVEWFVEPLPNGTMRGWWACQQCNTRFQPIPAAQAAEGVGIHRGEFICSRCHLRQDGEKPNVDF